MKYPKALQDTIDGFTKISGVGYKTAERYAFQLLDMPEEHVLRLAKALTTLKREIHPCKRCGMITENTYCDICEDTSRDETMVVVVEDSKDVLVFENLGAFRGRYHVLGGTLSPMAGISIEDIRLAELFERLRDEKIEEIVLALNATQEGEATSSFIQRKLTLVEGLRVTKLAQGIPIGGDIEYTDAMTMVRAFQGRQEF